MILKKNTHTKYSRGCLLSSDWSRHGQHSLSEIQRGKRLLYPITCFGSEILFCFCYLVNLTLGQKAASWDKSLEQALAPCSLAQLVRRCTLHAPHTIQEGFWSRCTITLSGCTLLPGSQLASPYGQLFLDIAAHSERDTVKSIIMPTEPNLHIRDHLQYESR